MRVIGNLSKKKVGGSEGSIGYVIAAPDTPDFLKKKADLVLDDVNGSPHTQLADMVDMLHDRRGQNTDIAIVIEFCPGIVELPNGTNWVIPEEKGNIYIYGNGVKINGYMDFRTLFSVVDCWLFDLEVKNSGFGGGISATYSTLTNCTGSGVSTGIDAYNSTLTNCTGSGVSTGIYADNSTLTNCTGSGGEFDGHGIYAINSTLSDCTGISERAYGIYAEGLCIIQGCGGGGSGISVPSTGTYPQTSELLQQLNRGTITIRS